MREIEGSFITKVQKHMKLWNLLFGLCQDEQSKKVNLRICFQDLSLSPLPLLNFDGNFIKDERRGTYGGVIWESNSHISCSCFGLVAFVYAMLMGCCKLCRNS